MQKDLSAIVAVPWAAMAASLSIDPGNRAPEPGRTSRRGLDLKAGLLLGTFLIVGSGMAFGLVYLEAADRTTVLVAAEHIPPGTVITEDNTNEVEISIAGAVDPVRAADTEAWKDRVAQVELPKGAILTKNSLAKSRAIPAGQSIVVVAVAPGQAPELRAGDKVAVIVAGSTGAPLEATVDSVVGPEEDELVRETLVSLRVAQSDAARIAAAAGEGDVVLALQGPPEPTTTTTAPAEGEQGGGGG
jgi:flagellar basal body P-ring formation chaperone FlgA